MTSRKLNLAIAFVVGLVVVGCATLQAWYDEYFYGADGISYFDMAKCMARGDWAPALNPYWSIGYPLVLAGTRWMFPAGPMGEWTAIRVTTLATYIVTYICFLHFLRVAIAYAGRAGGGEATPVASRGLYVAGSLIFTSWQIESRIGSRTTPDLMVSCLFFLLMAAALRFCLRPDAKSALLMGLWAGLGYVTKAFFLPLSCVVFAVFGVRALARPDRFPALMRLAWALPVIVLVAGPYVLGMSMVLGRFTLGESGSLNYAWTVNKLAHWHWVGGPEEFGEPIHPFRVLSENPHVYEFGEPMHVTYPPFFNPWYWYEGYRQFFSLKNEIAAIRYNWFQVTILFFNTPHAPVKLVLALACVIALIFVCTDAKIFFRRLLALWPVYVPALIGVVLYLLVCLEVRYVMGFFIILVMMPLLAAFVPTPLVRRKTGVLILAGVSLICLVNLAGHERPLVGRALRHESYTTNEDWRVGLYLAANGPPPGTKVAMVRIERGMETTWAYVPGLHIVSQIGNQDFTEAQQIQEFQLFVDHPDVQTKIFDLFRKAGAVMVVALPVQGAPQGGGWTQVPGTKAWVHAL